MNILLVDDDINILEILEEFLTMKGHSVATAINGKAALELVLAANEFDVVFSDIKMPEMDGLSFLKKLRNNDVQIPVILISGQGDLESSIRALKLGALDFILKPVYLKTLDEALQKIDTALAAERETIIAQKSAKDQQLTFECNSQMSHIRQIISYFVKQTKDICTNYDLDSTKLTICLQECLSNAIIHGNFAIDSKLKESDWSAFDNLIKQRENDASFSAKSVSVLFQQTPTLMRFTVSDQGLGFNPDDLPDPADPSSWLKLSGRGILFIRSYMDEVHWNDVGNQIVMSKYLN
ncbi:MAG: YesN/AraC family two-component response regulator [Pseudohongiellaceae bacterium]|jgi:YesN/AraC family two-component response regulator